MRRDATDVARRRFLATGALGACGALASTARVSAAEPTAEEKANVQIVKDFCAAWAKKDMAKIESLLADNIAVRWSERAPWINGKATAFERIKGIFERPGVEKVELELVETYPRGPLVMNDRWDRTVREGKMSQHRLASIFFIKDGKIAEWLDYDLPDPKTIRPSR
jgi:limonene-1,2-epoxide hydrolase